MRSKTDVKTATQLLFNPLTAKFPIVQVNDEVAYIINAGTKAGYTDFEVLCEYPMLTRPAYKDEWWVIPEDQDDTILPPKAVAAKKFVLDELGITPAGFLIGHEVPKQLTDSKHKKVSHEIPKWVDLRSDEAFELLGEVVVFLAKAFVAFIFLAVGFILFALANGIDPCLILVTQPDDTGKQYWIVLHRWVEDDG